MLLKFSGMWSTCTIWACSHTQQSKPTQPDNVGTVCLCQVQSFFGKSKHFKQKVNRRVAPLQLLLQYTQSPVFSLFSVKSHKQYFSLCALPTVADHTTVTKSGLFSSGSVWIMKEFVQSAALVSKDQLSSQQQTVDLVWCKPAWIPLRQLIFVLQGMRSVG